MTQFKTPTIPEELLGDPETAKDLIAENKSMESEIVQFCGNCRNRSTVEFGRDILQVCYDDRSFGGRKKPTWHVIYCETLDICAVWSKQRKWRGNE